MKILSLSYKNSAEEWELLKTDFGDLTLLVGASGVGKTQILSCISTLQRIAFGSYANGVQWEIEIQTTDGSIFKWSGAFGLKKEWVDEQLFDPEEKDRPSIIFEKLFLGENLIIDRTETQIIFYDKPINVKLSQQRSIINHLQAEQPINMILKGFLNILINDFYFKKIHGKETYSVDRLKDTYRSFNDLINSSEAISVKFFAAHRIFIEEFQKIVSVYKGIFPRVEDLKIDFVNRADALNNMPRLMLKEKGVTRWIPEWRISRGMYITLARICDIYLSIQGTIFLIDEFENSLGVNCIDEITAEILNSERKLQFIITSHHPYIINNVDFKHWKLVTRNGGSIKTHRAADLNLGKSKHEKFMQLINLRQYQTGSE